MRQTVTVKFRRRGGVIALSGGVDSAVTASLAVRALGAERVLCLLMPDRESSDRSLPLARGVAEALGVAYHVEDITSILEAQGCYRHRDEAIRKLVPEYGTGWACKIALSGEPGTAVRIFSLVVRSPEGAEKRVRLGSEAYRMIVAAMNFKQRTRTVLAYFHADRLHYAVIGTSNRLETDQGFFVKQGDGAGDFKPIAHLYKSQVYQLAEYLGISEGVRSRQPTPDTYPLAQTHEEFYFPAPYQIMDLCMWARDRAVPAEQVAHDLGRPVDYIRGVYKDIDLKRRVSEYLSSPPVVLKDLD